MKLIRFLMVGGFLGAGKTTAIARLARQHLDRGLNVGLVTNDQAYDLVDTLSLRAQGFRVGEVPGACFCCKFDDLVETAARLSDGQAPDVIISEPVGSCTDLVATVVEPLRHLHGDQYEIGPLTVLLKPEHGQKILRAESGVGFSPKAAYIFLKQLEEADLIAVNKVDKLSTDEQEELRGLLEERFPSKPVFLVSARNGDGFDELAAAIAQATPEHTRFMDVDYDVYAEGEAELGWLNGQCELTSSTGERFSLDEMAVAIVRGLRDALQRASAEPAHLKVLVQAGEDSAIANLVGSNADVELSLASEVDNRAAQVVVNARVAVDPAELESLVVAVVRKAAEDRKLDCRLHGIQRFRPGRPVPTHRMANRTI